MTDKEEQEERQRLIEQIAEELDRTGYYDVIGHRAGDYVRWKFGGGPEPVPVGRASAFNDPAGKGEGTLSEFAAKSAPPSSHNPKPWGCV